MTINAFVEVDGGATWQGHANFAVRPEVDDVIVYGPGGVPANRAKVIGFEHREQTDEFVFVICAQLIKEAVPYDIRKLIG